MHHDKISSGNSSGLVNLLRHDKRQEHDTTERGNKNIDPALTHLNEDLSLRQMGPGEAAMYARDYAQAHSARKIRANQVIVSEFIVHEPENWRELYGEDNAPFFEMAVGFLRERYGVEGCANEVSAVVHRDEKKNYEGRDHLHWKAVPITPDGRLSHKQVNGRSDLMRLHDDFAGYLAARGFGGLDVVHEEREMRGKNAKTMPEYQLSKELERENERLRVELAEVAAERDRAREEVSTLHEAMAGLQERFRELVAAITEVAETMKLRPWFGSWKHALEALRENPIAQAAVAAGQPWKSEHDAKKAEKVIAQEVKVAKRELDSLCREAQERAQVLAEENPGRESRPRDISR